MSLVVQALKPNRVQCKVQNITDIYFQRTMLCPMAFKPRKYTEYSGKYKTLTNIIYFSELYVSCSTDPESTLSTVEGGHQGQLFNIVTVSAGMYCAKVSYFPKMYL